MALRVKLEEESLDLHQSHEDMSSSDSFHSVRNEHHATDSTDSTSEQISGSDPVARKAKTNATENVKVITPRAYQLEMLEESLRGNVIVAVSFVAYSPHCMLSSCSDEALDGYR